MNARIGTGLAIVVGLVLGACSSTHYVTIRHPLHVGQVDPNEVPFNARREERPRGLPEGALTDSASLTEVTPERVCVHTNLWALDEVQPDRGVYQNYSIALLNDQDGVEELYVANDDEGEVSLYSWGEGGFSKSVIYTYTEGLSGFTWNIMPAPVEVLP